MMHQTTQQMITLTEKAAAKVRQILEKENKKGYGFRLGVVPGGCASYMYQMEFEKEPNKSDIVLEDKEVKIFINPESVEFMKGSVVDYSSSLVNGGFKISNPNAKRSCGCGHSVG